MNKSKGRQEERQKVEDLRELLRKRENWNLSYKIKRQQIKEIK